MRIWITRAQPEADATAERLRAFGHEPVIQPVLEVHPLGGAPSLEGVGALAFTSRNGVRAFAALSDERALPVFTVGAATAEAARAAGFVEVASAAGDVAALAELIASRRRGLDGEVFYPAPEEPAGDLVGALAEHGILARTQAVYRTVPAEFEPSPAVEAVLVHSAKAARLLAASFDLDVISPGMTAVCISAAAAEPLRDASFGELLISPAPNETALLQTLDAWVVRQAPRRMFTPLFWAVIAFSLVCILAAVLVVSLGPRLFPVRAAGAAPTHAQPLQIRRNSG